MPPVPDFAPVRSGIGTIYKTIHYNLIDFFRTTMAKKALLMILDGWGIGQHGKGDVIYNTPTPYLDYLTACLLYTSPSPRD